jgi:hypothetical protein
VPPAFRPARVVRANIESTFPNLANTDWFIKSPYDDSYQCIAWAACRTDRKWWPVDITRETYWPPSAPLDDTVESFVQAFAALGYRTCDHPDFELGYQKVAIYADENRRVRHMARQHFFGRGWLSKPGKLEDILHPDLASIEGNPSPTSYEYGKVAQVLKRSWWVALVKLCLFRCSWAAFKHWLYRLVHPSWVMKSTPRRG